MEQKTYLPAINTYEIKRRSVIGAITLTSRTFILQIIATVATFALTILLEPAAFGIFFVVTAVVNFLNYFSDIGLAAALIQKKEEPTQTDLATTFTIQQLLVGVAVGIVLLFSGTLNSFYKLGPAGLFLLRALTISFFLSSLKTIPSILLERKLDFHRLVIPQIAESMVFYTVAILLAWKGHGVNSFAWAALARGITGTVILYMVAPWEIAFAFNKISAKKLLAFGLPFQANSFLALIKDDLLIVFLGKILPFTYVGYIGWAKKWSEIALRLIMDNIMKVTFPTYSRLQHHPELLRKAIEKSLLFMALFSLPVATGMMFLIKPFIEIVPKYSKWEPALFSFYLFTISSVLAALSSPLINALNALGKVKYTFYLMTMWTVLTWTLVPIFVSLFSFHGVAIAAVLIGLTSFVPLFFVKKVVRINFWQPVIRPLVATCFLIATLIVVTLAAPTSATQLIFGIGGGIGIYVLLIHALLGKELVQYIELLFKKSTTTSSNVLQ